VLKTSFYINLIPETVSVTTFKDIKKGDLINIEVEQSTINTVETVKKIMSQRKV
jgi:riboflavin synthase